MALGIDPTTGQVQMVNSIPCSDSTSLSVPLRRWLPLIFALPSSNNPLFTLGVSSHIILSCIVFSSYTRLQLLGLLYQDLTLQHHSTHGMVRELLLYNSYSPLRAAQYRAGLGLRSSLSSDALLYFKLSSSRDISSNMEMALNLITDEWEPFG